MKKNIPHILLIVALLLSAVVAWSTSTIARKVAANSATNWTIIYVEFGVMVTFFIAAWAVSHNTQTTPLPPVKDDETVEQILVRLERRARSDAGRRIMGDLAP